MTLTPLTQLIIDRSKWRTGGNGKYKTGKGATTYLLHPVNDNMCCLGFACEQIGVDLNAIRSEYAPKDLGIKIPGLVKKTFLRNKIVATDLTTDAIHINDNSSTTPAEKELLLTERFAKEGIEVIFTGEYDTERKPQ